MAQRGSYGDILREARERKGMDVGTASRRLRIRPDILRAIEEADFARLPARGYSRNMVNAYARMVGLNASELTDRFLDELYAYEIGRQRPGTPAREAGASYSRPSSSERPSRSRAARDRSATGRYDRTGASEDRHARSAPRGSRSARPRSTSHREPRSNPNTFPSLYSNNAPSRGAAIPHLPLLAGVIIVVLIVIIALVVLFGGPKQQVQETPTVPISGLTDTSSPDDEEPVVQEETAPTSLELVYEVASGGTAWIETYENGSATASVAEAISGPSSTTVTVTGTFTIRTANVSPVTVTVNGEKVELTADDDGYYSYTADFQAYLEQWNAEHGKSSSSSNTSGNLTLSSSGQTGSASSNSTTTSRTSSSSSATSQ